MACFRVAQRLCPENESSSWTETNTCSPINNRSQVTHSRPLLPTHPFPFISQITLSLLSPWVGQKEIFSPDFLLVKLCYCLVTHHRQECSCFSTHKPAALCLWGPLVSWAAVAPSLACAAAHRNTNLAVPRCMWSSCSALNASHHL